MIRKFLFTLIILLPSFFYFRRKMMKIKAFARQMSFKMARLYDVSKFSAPSEAFEKRMCIEVLYSVKFKGKRDKISVILERKIGMIFI